MASRHRSAWRRRRGHGRVARLGIFFAVPVVLGLVIGAVVAFNGGGSQDPTVAVTPLGATQSPAGGGSAASPAVTRARNSSLDVCVRSGASPPANGISMTKCSA